MAESEVKLLNAVCHNKDIGVLLSANADEIFVGYPDAWQFIKDYYAKYRAVPDASVIKEKFTYFDVIPVNSPTEYYLDTVREEYERMRLRQINIGIGEGLKSMAPREVLEKALRSLNNLSHTSNPTKAVDITNHEAAEEHFEIMREKAALMGGVPGIPTGIGFIDSAYTSGLVGGDLVVVLGFTGRAKSLITTLIACNAYNKGHKPLIVTLEMPAEKVRSRAYTMLGNGIFANSDLEMGAVNEDDFRNFAKNKLTQEGFIVVPGLAGEFTPAAAQAHIDEFRSELLIVDYAQLGMDNSRSLDMTSRMRNQADEYKAIAMKNDIPVILISSATPESVSNLNTPPVIEQVAWSKQLAYNADLAFAVHKHEGGAGEAGIIEIAGRKNRNGDLFSGYFKADINRGKYQEFFDLSELAGNI